MPGETSGLKVHFDMLHDSEFGEVLVFFARQNKKSSLPHRFPMQMA